MESNVTTFVDCFILWFSFEQWRPWSNRNYSIVSDRINKGSLQLGLHYLIGQRPFIVFSAIITKFATDISNRATLGSNTLSVVMEVERLMLDEIGHEEKARKSEESKILKYECFVWSGG